MALSRAAFQELVEEHAPALYRLAYRLTGQGHDAEDIVQETLRSAWTSRDRFDPNRGGRAWLASILQRRVVDRCRRVGRSPDPLAHELTDEMKLALMQLPDELRESLLLVVVGELTHQETADALGVPLGTVLSRVCRARQRLRLNFLAASRRTV